MKTSSLSQWGLVVFLITAATGLNGTHAGCSVSVTDGLPDPAPLILTPGGRRNALGFKLPSPSGDLVFAPGDEVRLVCTGPGNSFTNLDSNPQDITVICVSDAIFSHGGERRDFNAFICSEIPQSATRRSRNRCNNNTNTVLEIGFQVKDGEFFKVIDVCFDEPRLNNVWSKSYVLSVVRVGETGFRLAGNQFTAANFFPGLDPDKLYSKRTQRSTIGRIIGNAQASYYINSTHFLSRGLLSDSDNFIYKSQKLAALNFVNVAPQWEKFKAGLWTVVDSSIRKYADQNNEDLLVYSGTYGVTTLPDTSKNATERELYLSIKGKSKQVAVPAIFWKVVYEPISKRGVVLVSINNPHKSRAAVESDYKRYKVCETKRYVSRWYVCASSNQQVGLGYCCEVDDFRNFVTSLPPFEVSDLLT